MKGRIAAYLGKENLSEQEITEFAKVNKFESKG
jgi:hypothetical protein